MCSCGWIANGSNKKLRWRRQAGFGQCRAGATSQWCASGRDETKHGLCSGPPSARLEQAERTWERVKQLSSERAISQQEADDQLAQVDACEPNWKRPSSRATD